MFHPRLYLSLLALFLLTSSIGCDGFQIKPVAEKKTNKSKSRRVKPRSRASVARVSRSSQDLATQQYMPTHQGVYLPETGKIISLIDESVQFGPTLVIWLLDQSRSSSGLVENVTGQLRDYYSNPKTPAGDPKQADRLLTAVVTFGETTSYLLESPSGSGTTVAAALSSVTVDPSGRENSFAALQTVVDKYLEFRLQQNREIIIVAVTDEAGDDQQLVEPLIKTMVKNAIPVYVIGTSAPFGQTALLHPSTEAPLDFKSKGSWQPILQGPESRYSERIVLDRWGSSFGWDRINSGFGPFAWEYLARQTGGKYLIVRMAGYTPEMLRGPGGRPGSSLIGSYDGVLIQRYAPDYASHARYQALLEANAACRALHEAAQLGRRKILTHPVTEFGYKNEAQLNRDVTQAQLAAARLEPEINTLYDILKKGEADRGKLTSLRWQAGYDLAMGRATAAKVRIEGYNAILAVLKRGRLFEEKTSTTWVLQPANTIDAGSTLKKLSDRAQMYLQRVMKDHAGTPWARLAEQELETPVGWKWTER